MQASAHPRQEKGVELPERPARQRAQERSQRLVPLRGRPCAPIPRRGPATSGQGWAWPRALRRVPPSRARAPPGVARNAAPELGRRRVPGKGFSPLAPPSRRPLGRVGSGRAGGEWARVEARGWENRGTEGAAPTPLDCRNFPNRVGWGLGGARSPAPRLRVGGEGKMHHRGLAGSPPPPSQPRCAGPRPTVTCGPASSPLPATVDREGRFLGPEGTGERLQPAVSASPSRGAWV